MAEILSVDFFPLASDLETCSAIWEFGGEWEVEIKGGPFHGSRIVSRAVSLEAAALLALHVICNSLQLDPAVYRFARLPKIGGPEVERRRKYLYNRKY